MTKQELFEKYSINETHNVWESTDSWMSVEVNYHSTIFASRS